MKELATFAAEAGLASPGLAPSSRLSELAKLAEIRDGVRLRPTVLVVEDNPEDRDLIAWAFEECAGRVDLHWVEDGEQALEYLAGCCTGANGAGRPRPALVILDLDLPKLGGVETLQAMRADLALRTIPVVVFTGSGESRDITRCYELGANSYFTKPISMEGYRTVIRMLETYWLRKVELPPFP